MRVSIFGLGYVGSVTAACLSSAGHEVWGVDISVDKVRTINAGRSPIVEADLEEMIARGRRNGSLRATTDPYEAVRSTDVSLVCVGTPSNENGSLNLKAITAVAREIGEGLRQKDSNHCVVFRSTVLPGTTRNVLIPSLAEASGRNPHVDFDVCFNPEFLREGTSVADFHHPPLTLIGQETTRGGNTSAALYAGLDAPVERAPYEVAEMVKYACNSFHALKITFANELGVLCKSLDIDSHRVMEIFALDKKLNISSAYLRPGFAFGGSCLPKDLRALLYKAKELDLNVPVLDAVLESNRLHVQRVIDWLIGTKLRKIGILGLSFKAGTDDLRESPNVALIEALIGKGCDVKIYDADVLPAKIFGANKEFIERELPHIANLLSPNVEDVLQHAEVIVICKKEAAPPAALRSHASHKVILDLVRCPLPLDTTTDAYNGICW